MNFELWFWFGFLLLDVRNLCYFESKLFEMCFMIIMIEFVFLLSGI